MGMKDEITWKWLKAQSGNVAFTSAVILIGRSQVPHGEEALQKRSRDGGSHLRAARS